MFFFASFGINRKMEPVGKVMAPCPRCGQSELFQLYCDYDSLELFFIPVSKYNKRYMALCCHCATAYHLDYDIGAAWHKGKQPSVEAKHLHPSQEAGPCCPRCGHGIEADYAFCPRCGHPFGS